MKKCKVFFMIVVLWMVLAILTSLSAAQEDNIGGAAKSTEHLCAPAPLLATFELIPATQTSSGVAGTQVVYYLAIQNELGHDETFDIVYNSIWPIVGDTVVGSVANGATQEFVVTVTIPADLECYEMGMAVITATARNDPIVDDVAYIETRVDPPGLGNFVITVYDINTNQPIEEAFVNIYTGQDDFIDWTTSDGMVAFSGIPACTCAGLVTAMGYYNQDVMPSIDPEMTTTLDIHLDAAWPELSDATVNVNLSPGQVGTLTVMLNNHGTGDLDFHISKSLNDAIYPMLANDMPVGVDGQVYADLADGTAKFIVYLAEQADLSSAFDIQDWSERGRYVFDTLRATAESSQSRLRAELDAAGVEYESRYIVNSLVVQGDLNLVEHIIIQPQVAFIGPNSEIPAPAPVKRGAVVQTVAGVVWSIQQVRADDVWSTWGATGEGIVVSNIDTGVLYTHTTLVNQYRGTIMTDTYEHNYNWWDPYGDQPNAPYDYDDHGSHTMGTMVGDDGGDWQIGMAPSAQWIACNGFEQGGSGNNAELIECAEFLLSPWDLTGQNADPNMRPHIINNSWGGGQAQWWYNQVVYAWRAAGIFPVFSAGNRGRDGCDTISDPGDIFNVMAVAATNEFDSNAPGSDAEFSSRGPAHRTGLVKPDVAAPGTGIISAGRDSATHIRPMSGTSMAAPHVAGQVALLWSAQPELIGDVQRTYWIIEQTARPLLVDQGYFCGDDDDANVPNNQYGWGRIDAFKAVSMAVNSNWEIDWLDVTPIMGIVSPSNSLDITLSFDSTGLGNMCYTGTLKAEFNDPYVIETFVPIELCVQSCAPLEQVSIVAPASGIACNYTFDSKYLPIDATQPISYLWDNGDTVHYSRRFLDMGVYTLMVTLTNECSQVTATHVISITKADIEVAPPAVGDPVLPDSIYTDTLTIANTGGYTLNWTLSQVEPIAWLAQSPTTGDVLPMESVDVELTFDATGLLAGEYTGTLCIVSNDLDEPKVFVPVMMFVVDCMLYLPVVLKNYSAPLSF